VVRFDADGMALLEGSDIPSTHVSRTESRMALPTTAVASFGHPRTCGGVSGRGSAGVLSVTG
jgi:hypothetical protein